MRARNYVTHVYIDENGVEHTSVIGLLDATERELMTLKRLAPELWSMGWTRENLKERGSPLPTGKPYFDSGNVSVVKLIDLWNGWGAR